MSYTSTESRRNLERLYEQAKAVAAEAPAARARADALHAIMKQSPTEIATALPAFAERLRTEAPSLKGRAQWLEEAALQLTTNHMDHTAFQTIQTVHEMLEKAARTSENTDPETLRPHPGLTRSTVQFGSPDTYRTQMQHMSAMNKKAAEWDEARRLDEEAQEAGRTV
ncbi:hypothetical protein BGLA2_610041 [Burkholderia gladioli]|uniref:hypothetical protein n=1 Tax=Burkholderia gladioli TaxID=28095 RepID=UPI001CB03C91|nr:hypothetical protein [Burkholderia gladioli]CAG9233790.1 hypothetical protein BGLA2_610041 [Burkholderia gladioli]